MDKTVKFTDLVPFTKSPSEITVELNGVANIHLIADEIRAEANCNALNPLHIDKKMVHIKNQLDVLERYMLELGRAAQEGRKNAFWHEVRDNRGQYPNNRGE